MNNKDYTATITVNASAEDIMKIISQVNLWWTNDIEGNSEKLNDEFIIRHADAHYSKQKLVELVPNKKIVWLVTDSKLNWLEKDKYEWTGTKMIFELTPNGDKTVLNFTHEGLVPGKECYERCTHGWDMVIKERLYNFVINEKFYKN